MLSKRGRCLQVKKVVTVEPYLCLSYTCTYMYMKILASLIHTQDNAHVVYNDLANYL